MSRSTNNTAYLRVGTGYGNGVPLLAFRQILPHSQLSGRPYFIYGMLRNEILHYILYDYLQRNYSVMWSSDGKWGGSLVGNQTGVVGDIINSDLDLSTPDFDMTYARSTSVAFGPAIFFSKSALFVNKNFVKYNNSLTYWNIFAGRCLLTIIVSLGGLLLLAKLTFQQFKHTHASVDCLLAIAFLVFDSLFNGQIIGTRSIASVSVPFTTIADSASFIQSHGFRLIGADESSALLISIKDDPKFEELQRALKSFPIIPFRISKAVELIRQTQHLFTYQVQRDLAVVGSDVMHIETIIDETSSYIMQSIMLDRRNHKFNEEVHRAVLLMTDTGILQKVDKQFKLLSAGSQFDFTRKHELAAKTPIRFLDLATTFYALVGIEMCILITFSPQLIKKQWHRRN